jgi:hypothetical protein
MVTQENNPWVIGRVDLDIDLDHRRYQFKKSQYRGSKLYSSAAIAPCEFPHWAQPLIQDLPSDYQYSWSLQCLYPNTVIKNKPKSPNNTVTLMIFLKKWCSGHYFELNNVPIGEWKAGTYVAWVGAKNRLNFNFGQENQYILELVGSL